MVLNIHFHFVEMRLWLLASYLIIKDKPASKLILSLNICGSITGGVILVCLTILIVKSFLAKKASAKSNSTRFISEDASSSYTSKLFTDPRYITQAINLGALNLPSYRIFSLDKLEAATNNFDTTNFMGEIPNGQMWK